MILELDTTLLDIFGEISINQLVFLTLVLNDNQSNTQDVHKFLSRISENDIQELIDNDLISFTTSGDNKIYSPTEKLLSSTKQDKTWFDEFYEVFPVYVLRPDGTKGFLRSNINKCRKEYNRIVGKSRAMHEHLLQCLQYLPYNYISLSKISLPDPTHMPVYIHLSQMYALTEEALRELHTYLLGLCNNLLRPEVLFFWKPGS